MTDTLLSPVDRAALKTAGRRLVAKVGGLDAAATVCRLNRSALAETYDPHRPDRGMPADVVADLEAVAAEPIVTQVLARLAGHALVPIAGGPGLEDAAIAEVGMRASGMFAAWARAKADARVTPAERKEVADELLQLQRACMQAVAALRVEGEE